MYKTKTSPDKLRQLSKLTDVALNTFTMQEIFDALQERTDHWDWEELKGLFSNELLDDGNIIIRAETVYEEYIINQFCKENDLRMLDTY